MNNNKILRLSLGAVLLVLAACGRAEQKADTAAGLVDTAVAPDTGARAPAPDTSPLAGTPRVATETQKPAAQTPHPRPTATKQPVETTKAPVVAPATTRDTARIAPPPQPVEPPKETVPPPPVLQPVSEEGRDLYMKNCRKCHGVAGVPSATMKKQYKELKPIDAAYLASVSDDSIAVVIRRGAGEMDGFAEKLSNSQILEVVKFLHTLPKQ